MKIAIVRNNHRDSIKCAQELEKKLLKHGFQLDDKAPDLVISVGGDGTLLSAFHRFSQQLDHIRFIGVHTGHLGFYTDWRNYETDELVQSLLLMPQPSISYPILDVQVTYNDARKTEHYFSLNEVSLKRASMTMSAHVYIKEECFENFKGDGLCVSTPTGSTAYNRSLGGAILHPRLEALQLTEIASINNRVYRTLGSPIVIAPDEWIVIEPENKRGEDYILSVDSFSVSRQNIKKITVKIARERIHFAQARHTPFWKRVKSSFIGNGEQ